MEDILEGDIKTTDNRGERNNEGTRFCQYCGSLIAKEDKFCKNCGKEQ